MNGSLFRGISSISSPAATPFRFFLRSMTNDRPLHVVIVGAGMAGMQLAYRLGHQSQERRNCRITILEAEEQIGGRVCKWEDPFLKNKDYPFAVEKGANWISGMETAYENPVWTLAKSIGLQGRPVIRTENITAHSLSNPSMDVTEDYLATVQRFQECYQKGIEYMAEYSGSSDEKQRLSIRQVLKECGWSVHTALERTVEYNCLEAWMAPRLENASAMQDLQANANDVDLAEDEIFVQDPRGFVSVVQAVHDQLLALPKMTQERLQILTQCEVEEIHYGEENRSCLIRATNTKSGKPLVIKDADVVVCTTSLGVLQQNVIQFSPPIPEWKQEAWNQLGMFCFAKTICAMDPSFQPPRSQFVLINQENGNPRYSYWMKYHDDQGRQQGSPRPNLYLCYAGGAEAERLERMDSEALKDELEAAFSRAFGDRGASGFRPLWVGQSNWSQNRHFYGSYSYHPPGVNEETIQLLQKPLGGNRLYFAGEACDDSYNGWVQGAYRSGDAVARQILHDYESVLLGGSMG